MPDAVAEAFIEALPSAQRSGFAAVDVGAELRAGWRHACELHGDFGLPLEAFACHVARRLGADATLRDLRLDDLLLAWACLQRAPAALRALDRVCTPIIDRVRKRVGLEVDAADFRQRVYQRMLVCDGDGPPRIATYRGNGPLEAWVRMVASRLAIDERRRVSTQQADLATSLLGSDVDVELDVLRERFASPFRVAFREAVEALDPDHRALLRLRYLQGLSVSEIARLRGIHRVTMSRLLTEIRQTVLDAIVHALEHDRVSSDEVASALRLVRSRLDLSLSALDY